jgi:hypothetical protein
MMAGPFVPPAAVRTTPCTQWHSALDAVTSHHCHHIQGPHAQFTCQHGVQLLLKVAPREHVRSLPLLIHLEHRLPQRVLLPRHYRHLQGSAESLWGCGLVCVFEGSLARIAQST